MERLIKLEEMEKWPVDRLISKLQRFAINQINAEQARNLLVAMKAAILKEQHG